MTGNDRASQSYERLHPRVQRWIWKEGWTTLHDIQENAIQAILDSNRDVIITAATAGGKTEAAFLPLASQLVSREERGGSIDILYISPLKALINDQWQRLDGLCEDLEIPVHRWHGDVSSSKKRKLLDDPEGILLITPESLEALFVNHGPRLRTILGGLSGVVIDELHAFIGTERGMQLQSQLHRIEALLGRRPRRLALSATLGDMSLASEFLRPSKGSDVELISSEAAGQEVRLQIRGYEHAELDPREELGHEGASGEEDEREALPEIAIAKDLFATLRGTNNLVFANSRGNVERYTDRLRRMCDRARLPQEFWPHHGSLSKELRTDVEVMIKSGDRPITIVCTSTLELGIDIGSVKSVAQIGCPPGVASLRQRLGRSGRRGEPAIVRFYVKEKTLDEHTNPLDRLRPTLVQAIAMVELLRERWYEPPDPKRVHGSTLVQQILSAIAQYGGLKADEAWRLLCETGPFDGLTKSEFAGLIRALGVKEIVMQSSDGTLLLGEDGEAIVGHYSFFAAFSAPEEFRVVAEGRPLGTIGVDVTTAVGDLLILAGRRWRITEIDERGRTVYVASAPGGRPPMWSGGGAKVHEKIRQKMREIYLADDVPPYLDATARRFLEEGRVTLREFQLETRSIHQSGEETYLFPWTGDRQMETLVMMLKRHGLEGSRDGMAIEIASRNVDRIEQALRAIAEDDSITALALIADAPHKETEKWDSVLSDALLDLAAASRSLDVPGARRAADTINARIAGSAGTRLERNDG